MRDALTPHPTTARKPDKQHAAPYFGTTILPGDTMAKAITVYRSAKLATRTVVEIRGGTVFTKSDTSNRLWKQTHPENLVVNVTGRNTAVDN